MADNPQAFPPNAGWRDNDPNQRGMTLLDYFAGQALAGIGAWCPTDSDGYAVEEERRAEMRAKWAYIQAAAMLNERQSHEG